MAPVSVSPPRYLPDMDVIDFPTDTRRSLGWSDGRSYGRSDGRSDGGVVTTNDATASDFRPRTSQSCMHERIDVGRLTLDLCPDSGEAVWLDAHEEVDPAEALARLFGNFDLCAALPALRAPGEVVLAYAPDGRRGRAAMRCLPAGRWIEGAPGLWLTHDGARLLMSPADRLLADNLMRDL